MEQAQQAASIFETIHADDNFVSATPTEGLQGDWYVAVHVKTTPFEYPLEVNGVPCRFFVI